MSAWLILSKFRKRVLTTLYLLSPRDRQQQPVRLALASTCMRAILAQVSRMDEFLHHFTTRRVQTIINSQSGAHRARD